EGNRRRALAAGGFPLAGVFAWFLYVRLRLGWESAASQVEEIGLRFVGFAQAMQHWLAHDTLGMAVGIVPVAVMVASVLRVLRGSQLVGRVFLGFAALGVVMTRQVWLNYFDITRAVAPALTAYVLLLFVKDGGRVELGPEILDQNPSEQ